MSSIIFRTARPFFLLTLFTVVFLSGNHTVFASGEPVVANVFPQNIMPTSATPTGEVTDEGAAAVIGIWVDYGTDTNYGSEVQRYNLNELTLPGNFDVPITGLTCDTTYHYRFKVRNNGMLDGYSSDDTFTTSPCYPDDIISHWTLNEGDPSLRYDSVGTNDLASHGNPSTLTAHFNDGVGISTDQYLDISDNASLSTGGETNFTVSLWVKLASKTGTQVFVSKYGNGAGGEYAVYFENTFDRFVFSTYSSENNYFVKADTLGSPQVGTWYHIVATHDAENNINKITVNDIGPDTVSSVPEHADSTAPFVIGAFGPSHIFPANATIDDVRFSKSAVVDTTAPTVQTISPADGTNNVDTDTNIVLTFSEPVVKGSGLITLATDNNMAMVDNINVTSGQVSGEGTTTITIDPSFNILPGTEVFVNIPNTAFKDAANNYFAGFTGGLGNVPMFTIAYAPYVITSINPIPAKIHKNTATYTFSVSGQGEAEYIAEKCGGDADGYFTNMANDPEHQSVTLVNLKPGITYECQFGIQSLSGYSNFVHIGPFRVSYASGYASPTPLLHTETPLVSQSNSRHICPADQLLTFPVNIKKLQAHLVRLGLNPGPIDGIRGSMTTAAIKQAQAKLGTRTDGLVGPLTRNLINNSCK